MTQNHLTKNIKASSNGNFVGTLAEPCGETMPTYPTAIVRIGIPTIGLLGLSNLFQPRSSPVPARVSRTEGTRERPGTQIKAKAGLHRGILASGWYQLEQYLQYKAYRVVKVHPAYT